MMHPKKLLLLLSALLPTALLAQPRPEALSILKQYEARPGVKTTIVVRDLQTGQTILSYRSDESFRPASLVKLATTGAFLALRGSDYRFSMPIALRGEVAGEVLHGDLVVGASADPSLGSHFLPSRDRLIRQISQLLQERGIRRIEGRLVLDLAGFPQPYYSEHWPDEDLSHYYAVPVAGLSISDNYADLYLYRDAGGVESDVQLGGLSLPHTSQLYRGAATSLNLLQTGQQGLRLEGSVPGRNGSRHIRQPLADPPLLASIWLREGLRRSGIELTERSLIRYDKERLQGLDTLGFYTSPPADSLAKITNYHSSNSYAEALAYALNRPEERATGAPIAMRNYWHQRLKLSGENFWPQDGSGLSPTGLLTSEALTRILSELWHDKELRTPFLASLPEAGMEGTVRSVAVPDEIQAFLKSGTMRGVRGYAGYIKQEDSWYSVVYIANGNISPAEARNTFSRFLTGLFTSRPIASLLPAAPSAHKKSASKVSSTKKKSSAASKHRSKRHR